MCNMNLFFFFFFPPVLRERFQSETKAQSCVLGNSTLPSPLTLRRRTSVMSWRVHPSLSQDDSRIISYSRRIETSKMGAGYYPTDLWGGLQTPPLFQFCPSRTDGKIRLLQTLRLARAGPCLLWVISMGMQWNGAWILPEPAMLCWAPSFPHRNEKKKKKKKRRPQFGSTSVVASQMAESPPLFFWKQTTQDLFFPLYF